MNAPGGDRFDQWLGQQLQQHVAGRGGPSPLPTQAQYHSAYLQGGVHVGLLAKVAAVLSTKAAIAVTAGLMVVSAAGAGEAVITGSVNPGDWGKQVVQQVQKCKGALVPGSHGIGECVSSFASQHGKTVSSEHRANPNPSHGPDQTPPVLPTDKDHAFPHPHPTPPVHPSPPGSGHK
jgi:hypothetical protein